METLTKLKKFDAVLRMTRFATKHKGDDKKRMSKKNMKILQSMIFFISTVGIILCLIVYLWVYTEIDETLLTIEIQNSTAEELQNVIHELSNQIESLIDTISRKCREILKA